MLGKSLEFSQTNAILVRKILRKQACALVHFKVALGIRNNDIINAKSMMLLLIVAILMTCRDYFVRWC